MFAKRVTVRRTALSSKAVNSNDKMSGKAGVQKNNLTL